jgi:alkylation response protein AidB-like acyl-CoA dehydrogenase
MAHPLIAKLHAIADDFAHERRARQMRRALVAEDFERLRDAGYLLLGVPEQEGGFWRSGSETTRFICEALRTLARGDSSVALVSAMHPAVLSYWLAAPDAAHASTEFQIQFANIIAGVKGGDWWGTITSEPGSGGDVAKTRAAATPTSEPHRYLLTGDKHFGSGSGMLRYMVTTAIAHDSDKPDWFYIDLQNVPFDGSRGVKLIAEWDGQGMTATQSHSLCFKDFPATRIAWPNHLTDISARSGPLIGCMFAAVIVGIVDAAMAFAREKLKPNQLRAYEQIEWERAQLEAWLVEQAFGGMLRAVETLSDARRDVLQGKTAIAELAEQILTRLSRVLGGGTFHRGSPIGNWAQDVKALGFLRPPWGLAWETLIAQSRAE